MMAYPIQTVSFSGTLPLPRREILRYMRCTKETPEIAALMDEALAAVVPLLRFRACYTRFPLRFECERVHLGFGEVNSRSLLRRLDGCTEVLVFAATVGSDVDRLLTRLSALSPSRAVAADAVATAAIEAWCDRLCADWEHALAADGVSLTPRFSAGYGDCPLALQIPLVQALDTARQIGVSLTDSLLMTPTKSVTALIGLSHS